MVVLSISGDEVALRRLVGTKTFLQGRELVGKGDVVRVSWHEHTGRAFGEVRGQRGPNTAMAMLTRGADGDPAAVSATCTCGSASPCPHAVALLLATIAPDGEGRGQAAPGLRAVESPPAPPAWERRLAAILPRGSSGPPGSSSAAREQAEVALQFELLVDEGAGRTASSGAARIGIRPVIPGAKGGWVRGGISWSTLMYSRYSRSLLHKHHLRLLAEILALDTEPDYYRYTQKSLFLEDFASRRIWDLLAEARELGLPLVQADRRSTPVVLHTAPARVTLEVGRTPSGLALEPRVLADGAPVAISAARLIGTPTHGIAWWRGADEPDPEPKDRVLRLAPLATAIDNELVRVLAGGTIAVPSQDEDRFLRDYYPRLRQRLSLVATDESVELPQARPPVLALTVRRIEGHRVALTWQWVYALGDAERREPLWQEPGPDGERDAAAEAAALRPVLPVVRGVAGLTEHAPGGLRIVPEVTVGGLAMIAVLNDVVPALRELPDVEVTVVIDAATPELVAPDYREATEAPLIVISGEEATGDHDWFDLAVTVSVEGQQVPFSPLFVALAQEQDTLILDNGTYFSLDREELRQLGRLIAEARALQDAPRGGVRLSRFQAGLWAELERIGVIDGQAAVWQESVRALTGATGLVEHPAPPGLNATLRPYQLAGFRWLAALHEYRLGGILSDDMGLGKTVQALALVCRVQEQVRERGETPVPFLVVAPTSVVFNWKAEAARFTPGLTVAAIGETEARRGAALPEVIAGADLVVTSYTLFRLEYDDYAAQEWAGLILDEAQFVKNHQSQGYHCAKKLPAPFKLAITGTPMENNLMELWSLLSITAPGLFTSPTRFTEYYRTPIEKGRDADLLAQLRRRIRPLMLRRTKEQVVTDLPDKQEQVLELELNPKHKKVYQTYLQRERQKVLGLIDDFTRNRFEIFRSLTLLRQASLDVSLIDPKYASIPSTKLDAMMEQVADIAGEGHRTLIFSQFTRFLDAARRRLDEAGIEYCYLDGSTRNRPAVIEGFKTGTAPVFLISLKAGGVGLNLTEADYCILLDPWWNPATEAQAVDRVHRIGQTRKVMVYRLVAKDTIEEKVMALKATKAALFDSVMDGGAFESAALTASDIRGLLE